MLPPLGLLLICLLPSALAQSAAPHLSRRAASPPLVPRDNYPGAASKSGGTVLQTTYRVDKTPDGRPLRGLQIETPWGPHPFIAASKGDAHFAIHSVADAATPGHHAGVIPAAKLPGVVKFAPDNIPVPSTGGGRVIFCTQAASAIRHALRKNALLTFGKGGMAGIVTGALLSEVGIRSAWPARRGWAWPAARPSTAP